MRQHRSPSLLRRHRRPCSQRTEAVRISFLQSRPYDLDQTQLYLDDVIGSIFPLKHLPFSLGIGQSERFSLPCDLSLQVSLRLLFQRRQPISHPCSQDEALELQPASLPRECDGSWESDEPW